MRLPALPLLFFIAFAAAYASPVKAQVSDEEAVEYIRNTWDVEEGITDDVIIKTLDLEYSTGVPYKDLIGFFTCAPEFLDPLSEQDYQEAAEKSRECAGEAVIDEALEEVLGGTFWPVKLAAESIKFGLGRFERFIATEAFKKQTELYFLAREHNGYQKILDFDPGGIPPLLDKVSISKVDEGWLYKPSGPVGSTFGVPSTREFEGYTPPQFFAYAELFWQTKQYYPNEYATDNRKIEDSFLEATQTAQSNQGVEVALSIDRSGSMRGEKLFLARASAQSFVSQMQTGDKVAVVSFSSNASVNFPLTTLESFETKAAAARAILDIRGGGGTSIGAGLLASQKELDKGNQGKQAIVLLSDGRSSSVESALATIPEKTDVYTIALGANSDQVLLNNIANQTGGSFRFAPTAPELFEIYNAIRAKVTGQQVIASSSGTIEQGQSITESAQIDETVSQARFSVTWPGSDIDLTLEDPAGEVIDSTTAATTPGVDFSSGNTFEFYEVSAPAAGEWKLTITGTDIPSDGENYNLLATGQAALDIDVSFNRSEYPVGAPIVVSAAITQGEAPVTGANVTADVLTPTQASAKLMKQAQSAPQETADKTKTLRPQLSIQRKVSAATASKRTGERSMTYVNQSGKAYFANAGLVLSDDGSGADAAAGDGVYTASFDDTDVEGSYSFNVTASGTTPTGSAFTREASNSTVVTSSAVVDDTPPVCGDIEVVTEDGVGVAVASSATDEESGIASATFTRLANLEGQLNGSGAYQQGDSETFNASSTTEITIRGNRLDMTDNRAALVVNVTNGAGLSSTCDPVIETIGAEVPASFALEANYPNPFNPTTTIPFKVAEGTHVTVDVYDALGRKVATLVNRQMSAGSYEATWDAGQLPSGVYMYRISAGSFTKTRMMTLVK